MGVTDLDTSAQGAPASCERTATELRTLGRVLGESVHVHRRAARIDPEDFEGRTADAFREACTDLGADSITLQEGVSDFAGAITEYGARLSEILHVLRRARTTARSAGLTVVGTVIRAPSDAGLTEVFNRLAGLVADARAVQAHAEYDLTRAIDRITPGRASDDILGRIEDMEDQPFLTGPGDTGGLPPLPTWPPPESAWPTPAEPPITRPPDPAADPVADPVRTAPVDDPRRTGSDHPADLPQSHPTDGEPAPSHPWHAAAGAAAALAMTGVGVLRRATPEQPAPPEPQPPEPLLPDSKESR